MALSFPARELREKNLRRALLLPDASLAPYLSRTISACVAALMFATLGVKAYGLATKGRGTPTPETP